MRFFIFITLSKSFVFYLGEDQVIAIDHCATSLCFTKTIQYEAPIEQIQALLKSPSTCTQTITWKCLLAPLKVSKILGAKWKGLLALKML